VILRALPAWDGVPPCENTSGTAVRYVTTDAERRAIVRRNAAAMYAQGASIERIVRLYPELADELLRSAG